MPGAREQRLSRIRAYIAGHTGPGTLTVIDEDKVLDVYDITEAGRMFVMPGAPPGDCMRTTKMLLRKYPTGCPLGMIIRPDAAYSSHPKSLCIFHAALVTDIGGDTPRIVTQTMGLRKDVPMSAYVQQNTIVAASRGEHGTWEGFHEKVEALCARFGKVLPGDC